MRIFFAGDAVTGTGPANVTKYYIENLPVGTLHQKMTSKIARVPEIIINTIRADVTVYSGYSKQNILGMKVAKFFGKPTAYLMHGCVEYENEINLEPDDEMCKVERKVMELADRIYAVSPGFAGWLREHYEEYADKIDYIPNGIDDTLIADSAGKAACSSLDDYYRNRDRHKIMSIGGGMPRKRIVNLCKAVAQLREDYDSELTLVVIGAKGADSDSIESFDFVDNKGLVSFEESTSLLRSVGLFVQNSCFETFGLAPIEAICCGCSTLCSAHVGALCLIDGLDDSDVIENCDDVAEIAQKIRHLIDNPNYERLSNGIDWENNSWAVRSKIMIEKLSELVQ